MIRRPPRATPLYSSAASDVYKRQDGLGVVRHEGLCFFVKDLLKGESAEIGVTAVKKNVGYGRVIRRLSESPQRVEPRCPVARQCGGCQLQTMGAELQAEFKRLSLIHI